MSPKPLFRTPGSAAYCYVDALDMVRNGAKLTCWTPNDGWVAFLGWRQRRARTAYYDEPPAIAHGLRKLKGYAPRARLLRFGETWRVRCTNPANWSTCRAKDGVIAFTCTSRRTGLTCRNAAGHGYWIGRYRGYRLF